MLPTVHRWILMKDVFNYLETFVYLKMLLISLDDLLCMFHIFIKTVYIS